jgi:signal recognition particle GTPase
MAIKSQAWAKSTRPYLNNNEKLKRVGGMTQVVQHLPGKAEGKFKHQYQQKHTIRIYG